MEHISSLFSNDEYSNITIFEKILILITLIIYYIIKKSLFIIIISIINIINIIKTSLFITFLYLFSNDINILLENKDKEISSLSRQLEKINILQKKYYSSYSSNSSNISTIRQNIINALNMQLDDKNKIINGLQKQLENDESNKCTICFNNTISHCCNPCGHTYCFDCINKTNNCYICRGNIRNKIKLYL
jgi:hypothetical protein